VNVAQALAAMAAPSNSNYAKKISLCFKPLHGLVNEFGEIMVSTEVDSPVQEKSVADYRIMRT